MAEKVCIICSEENKNNILDLTEFIEMQDYERVFFNNLREFSEYLNSANSSNNSNLENEIFLLLVDVCTYQSDLINPYKFFYSENKSIPVCVYNDPYPEASFRARYWMVKTRLYSSENIPYLKLKALNEFYSKLQYFMLLPEFKTAQYLRNSVITEAVKSDGFVFSKKKSFAKNKINASIKSRAVSFSDEFIKAESDVKKIIPTSRYRLLSFFFNNVNRNVSVEDMNSFLSEDGNVKKNSLYSYLSDLRKIIASDIFSGYKFERTGKGYYKLSYNPVFI